MNPHDPTQPSEGTETETARQRCTREAIAAVRSGDTQAFARLVACYEVQTMSLCMALMRDTASAEDLAQDVFVRAYRYLHTFDDRRPFFPWLAKIAYRLAQTRWQRKPPEVGLAEEAWGQVADASPDEEPLGHLVADEQARSLWRAVRGLPEGQRTSVVLYYGHGMAVRQVAQVMGVSTGTVKTFLFRARRRLHSVLCPIDGDAPDEGVR